MLDQIKYYTEFIENTYPRVKDTIIGELSTDQYSYIIYLATSIILHRDEIQTGGHFVQAICDNNLRDAVSRADSDAIRGLKFFVYCYNNVYPQYQSYN